MTYDVVHEQPLFRSYRAPTISSAYFVKVLFRVVDISLPLIIIFLTHGLWKKTGEFRETPDVSYEDNYIVIAQGKDNYAMSSSFPVLQSADPSHSVFAELSHRWMESGNDRMLQLELKIPLANTSADILSYIVFLRYRLGYHSVVDCLLPLSDTVLLSHSTAGIRVNARLKADQSTPFGWHHRQEIVDESRRDIDHFRPQEILLRDTQAQLSIHMIRRSELRILPETSRLSHFTLSLNLLVSEDNFTYKTDFWELMKWAWIQYLSMFIIVRFISNSLLDYLYYHRILEAIPSMGLANDTVLSKTSNYVR